MEMFAEIESKKSVLPPSACSACGSPCFKSDAKREIIAQHSLSSSYVWGTIVLSSGSLSQRYRQALALIASDDNAYAVRTLKDPIALANCCGCVCLSSCYIPPLINLKCS